MNAQGSFKPKVMKETKNKIRVEFDRTPLKERLKAKFLSLYFLQKVIWYVFRLVLLVGISYIVLFPFFSKIAGSFMSPEDFVDVTVRLIPKHFTLNTYKAIILENGFFEAFKNTLILSLSAAILQTFSCCLVGYGLAKFKFKGNKIVFLLVLFTMVLPHQTIRFSFSRIFTYFWKEFFGILHFLHLVPDSLASGINMINTHWPMAILSATALAFKNGLYIFLFRQFFKGVPDELEESAYIDGSGVFRTFFQIIIPLSIPTMITVFLFSFCWQWTDNFYTNVFYTTARMKLMPSIVAVPSSLMMNFAAQDLYNAAIKNACGILIILPLVILYIFCQRFLVQGIERSGLTAD